MNVRTPFAAIAALALSLTVLGGCSRQPAAQTPPLAGARLGGAFSLVDQDGRPTTDRNFAGRYRAVYFGYSFCPDVCPTTLQALMQGSDPGDLSTLDDPHVLDDIRQAIARGPHCGARATP